MMHPTGVPVLMGLLLSVSLTSASADEPTTRIADSRVIRQCREKVRSTDITRHRDRWVGVIETDAGLQIIASDDGHAWRSLSVLTAPDAARPLEDARLSVTTDGRLMLNAVEPGVPVGGFSRAWFSFDGVRWDKPTPAAEEHYLVSNVFWHAGVAYNFQRGSSCGNADVRIGISHDHGQSFQVRYEDLDLFGAGKGALVFSQDDGYCVMSRVGGDNIVHGMIGVSRPPFWQWKWKKQAGAVEHPNAVRARNGALLVVAGLTDDKGVVKTTLCELDPNTLTLDRIEDLPTNEAGLVGLARDGNRVFISYHTETPEGSAVHFAQIVMPDKSL